MAEKQNLDGLRAELDAANRAVVDLLAEALGTDPEWRPGLAPLDVAALVVERLEGTIAERDTERAAREKAEEQRDRARALLSEARAMIVEACPPGSTALAYRIDLALADEPEEVKP